jgi:hypothetical protein
MDFINRLNVVVYNMEHFFDPSYHDQSPLGSRYLKIIDKQLSNNLI